MKKAKQPDIVTLNFNKQDVPVNVFMKAVRSLVGIFKETTKSLYGDKNAVKWFVRLPTNEIQIYGVRNKKPEVINGEK